MGIKTPSITQLKSQLAKLKRDRDSPTTHPDTDGQIAKIEVAILFHKAWVNACQGIDIAPPSVEWYSPSWLIELAREVLGSIDLDPASNEKAQGLVRAGQFYTKEQDGLKQPWRGNVFCNPPYGDKYVLFLERAIALYEAPHCQFDAGIFLVNRSGAKCYRDVRNEFTVLCELHDRVRFLNAQGEEENSPRYNNDVLYLGEEADKFIEHFHPYGDCRILN